jgi:hypothetical protein
MNPNDHSPARRSTPLKFRECFNGNHWAQQQAQKAGIEFTPLDNAFATVDNPAGLQQICDRLGPDQIQALLDKWLAILPNLLTARLRGDDRVMVG